MGAEALAVHLTQEVREVKVEPVVVVVVVLEEQVAAVEECH